MNTLSTTPKNSPKIEKFTSGIGEILIKQGDLVDERVDAIICPANSFNHMRGGVAGTIRMRGGDLIEQEAMAQAPVAIGGAIMTSGGALPSRYVIHAPTMRLPVERSNEGAVKMAVCAALACASQNRLRAVAFPGMGTGTGGVPYDVASRTMLVEIARFLGKTSMTVSVIAYNQSFYETLCQTARELFHSDSANPVRS